jgi:hypothetical protein
MESLIERGVRMDGERFSVNLCRDTRFGANVAEVSREAVAQVDGGGSETASLEPQALRDARLRIQMRGECALNAARDYPEWSLSGFHQLAQALKSGRSATKASGHVEEVSRASAGTQQSPAARHSPGEDNIRQGDGGLGEVATAKRGRVAAGEGKKAAEEAVCPRRLLAGGGLCQLAG